MSQVPENAAIALMPAATEFAATYQEGRPQVVWTRLVADLETPVSAYMKLVRDRAPSFLLESIEGGESRGRYSIIGLAPDLIWRAEGEKAWLNRTPQSAPDAFEACGAPTLQALRDADERVAREPRFDGVGLGEEAATAEDSFQGLAIGHGPLP